MEFTNVNIIQQQFTDIFQLRIILDMELNLYSFLYWCQRKSYKFLLSSYQSWIRSEILLFLLNWPSHKSLCLRFLAIIYNFTFHTRSDFHLAILRAPRWTELATDVFTAGLTWWTCHILTEILIERVLKTIFLLWPNWLFISPLIWPSIAIKMPACLTEQNCLQAALPLISNTFNLLWVCSKMTRKLGRRKIIARIYVRERTILLGVVSALPPIN